MKDWIEKINSLLGAEVKIETKDGIYLEGKLTSIDSTSFELDKELVSNVVALQLDNDPEKVVDVCRLVKVKVLGFC